MGDNPFIFLDTNKIRATGWTPLHTIRESVIDTVRWLMRAMKLAGKRALITGGSLGLGKRDCAAVFARRRGRRHLRA